MKPRYSFVVPLRDDELDDAINRLYCGCLLSLAERERIAAWMETKRVYTVPEALQHEDMWWRDASRERPARDRLVIAWTEKYGALLANRDTSNPDFGWSCDGKVTHWMPLPSVPSPLARITSSSPQEPGK